MVHLLGFHRNTSHKSESLENCLVLIYFIKKNLWKTHFVKIFKVKSFFDGISVLQKFPAFFDNRIQKLGSLFIIQRLEKRKKSLAKVLGKNKVK